jgi:flagellar secretion chaperone FliS
MAANQQAQRYREVAVKTANPLQLVVILYDGAIHALQQAREHIKRKDISGRARCINRSLAIISELHACLNLREGGEIGKSLDRLYNYMKQRIFRANVEQRAEPLAEIVTLLENLRSAWCELAAQAQRAEMTANLRGAASDTLKNGTTGLSSLNISG